MAKRSAPIIMAVVLVTSVFAGVAVATPSGTDSEMHNSVPSAGGAQPPVDAALEPHDDDGDDDDLDPDADPDNDGLNNSQEAELGTDSNDHDTDNDTYNDGWEAREMGPGPQNAPLPDADPLSKDLYVHFTPSGEREAPSDATLATLESWFAGLPVENPDGSTGIDLHTSVGDGVDRELVYDARSTEFVFQTVGQEWTNLDIGNKEGMYHHVLAVNMTTDATVYADPIGQTTHSLVNDANNVSQVAHGLLHTIVGPVPSSLEKECNRRIHYCDGGVLANATPTNTAVSETLLDATINKRGYQLAVIGTDIDIERPEYVTVNETLNADLVYYWNRGRDPSFRATYITGNRSDTPGIDFTYGVEDPIEDGFTFSVNETGTYLVATGGYTLFTETRYITVYEELISHERTVSPRTVAPGDTIEAQATVNFSNDKPTVSILDGFSGPIASGSIDSITADGTEIPDGDVRFSNVNSERMTVALENVEAGESVTVTYTLTVADDAESGDTIEFVGSDNPDVGAPNVSANFSSVTVTVADSAVDLADKNGDGEISDGELNTAIVDWSNGVYTDSQLRKIIVAWAG